MIDYRKTLEKQIMDCDAIIHRIKLERGRKGIATFGITALFGDKDLKTEYEKQVKKKTKLIDELKATEQAIVAWSKNIYEKNDYFGGEGSAASDDTRQNPNTKKAEYGGLDEELMWDQDYNNMPRPEYSLDDSFVVAFESPSSIIRGPDGNAVVNYRDVNIELSPSNNESALTK
jgi:hypothetical protein